jgi:hypothetical protein
MTVNNKIIDLLEFFLFCVQRERKKKGAGLLMLWKLVCYENYGANGKDFGF